MAMSLPRTLRRSGSVSAARSLPSNRIWPNGGTSFRAGDAGSRATARFCPSRISPTIASVRLGIRLKPTLFTACTRPRGVSKRSQKSRTFSSGLGHIDCAPMSNSGARFAEPVHSKARSGTSRRREPTPRAARRRGCRARPHHPGPARPRRPHRQAERAERRLGRMATPSITYGVGEGRHQNRKDLRGTSAAASRRRSRGEYEFAAAQAQGVGACDARKGGDEDHANRKGDVADVSVRGWETSAMARIMPGKQQQHRHRAHDQPVRPASEIAADQAEGAAEREPDADAAKCYGERHLRAIDRARKSVAPERVRAQPVFGGRQRQGLQQVALVGALQPDIKGASTATTITATTDASANATPISSRRRLRGR